MFVVEIETIDNIPTMRLTITATFVALLFFCSKAPAQTTYLPEWPSLDNRPVSEWWLDAKFGIFIHWGIYSVPAFAEKGKYAEWYQHSLANDKPDGPVRTFHQRNFGERSYRDLASDFTATQFDADKWAALFARAGAKYVVLTTKHHDGFCLWPNEQSDRIWGYPWNAGKIGPRRDLVGELFGALRKANLRPGAYFSLYEWYNPLWQFDKARFARDHTMPQLRELVSTYQPDIVWADGDWDAGPDVWQSREFLAWLYNQSPVKDRVMVNDRWGSGVRFRHGGFFTPEYQPELAFSDHAWEESRGIGASYGLNLAEEAGDYLSARNLILHLIDKVSRGGNFLLNVGPDRFGNIPPLMQERLLDIGRWLSVNGEAIYATRPWRQDCQWGAGRRDAALKPGEDLVWKQTVQPDSGFAVKEIFFTWKPGTRSMYAIFPAWPSGNRLVLKDVSLPKGLDVRLLDGDQTLRYEGVSGATYVYLPGYNPNLIKAPEAFAIRISPFGDFVEKPSISVEYQPGNMQPRVRISAATPQSSIRFAIDDEPLSDQSRTYQQPLVLTKDSKVKAQAFRSGFISSAVAEAEVRFYPFMPALSMFREPQSGLDVLLVDPATLDLEGVEKGRLLNTWTADEVRLQPGCETGICGMVWQGYLKIPADGGYRFLLESDDGSRLLLDGQVIVDNGGDHGMLEKEGYAYLQAGWHAVKILYLNSGGQGGFNLRYGPVGGAASAPSRQSLGH